LYTTPSKFTISVDYKHSGSEHDGDVRFKTGSYMAISCMRNENAQHNRYLISESPKFPRLIINQGHPSIVAAI